MDHLNLKTEPVNARKNVCSVRGAKKTSKIKEKWTRRRGKNEEGQHATLPLAKAIFIKSKKQFPGRKEQVEGNMQT